MDKPHRKPWPKSKTSDISKQSPSHCITPFCSDALVSPPNLYPPCRAVTAKKCTKKAWCTYKVVVLLIIIKPIAFLPFSLRQRRRYLSSHCIPHECSVVSSVVLSPLLKKTSLDFEIFSNFRPVSNLKFLSKVIEKVAAMRLTNYLCDNDRNESLQSAYKKCYFWRMSPRRRQK